MEKIHRVWRRESKLPFHIIHLFTTLNCLGEAVIGDSRHPFLFCRSPCLPLPCHTKALHSHMLSVCHSLRGDQVFLPEEKREFPAVRAFALRNDHAEQRCAQFIQKYCSESGWLKSAYSHPWCGSGVTRAGCHSQQRNCSSRRSLGR